MGARQQSAHFHYIKGCTVRKINLSILPIACLWAVSACGSESAAPVDEHAHHAHLEAHSDAVANPAAEGTIYATDAPLRAGMLKIRELLSAPRPANAEAAKQLTDGIDAEVQQLFAQCKLEPAADAALHGVLALIIEGSAGLRVAAGDDDAWAKLQEALALYPKRFNNTGFETEPDTHK